MYSRLDYNVAARGDDFIAYPRKSHHNFVGTISAENDGIWGRLLHLMSHLIYDPCFKARAQCTPGGKELQKDRVCQITPSLPPGLQCCRPGRRFHCLPKEISSQFRGAHLIYDPCFKARAQCTPGGKELQKDRACSSTVILVCQITPSLPPGLQCCRPGRRFHCLPKEISSQFMYSGGERASERQGLF
jgi:hypothetical protein